MTIVNETLHPTEGVDPAALTVQVALAGSKGARLPAGYATVEGTTIVTEYRLHPDENGLWSLDLPSNEDIEPLGTAWMVSVQGFHVDKAWRYFFVPQSGPCEILDCLTAPPGVIESGTTALLQAQLANLPKVQDSESIQIDDTTTPGWLKLRRRALKCAGRFVGPSSSAEESLIDGPSILAAPNVLDLHSMARIRVFGGYSNNTGSNKNVTFRLRLNGDITAEVPITAIPTDTDPRYFHLNLWVTFEEFLGTRAHTEGDFNMGPAVASGTTGPSFVTLLIPPIPAYVDFAQPIEFEVTAQHSASDADLAVGASSVTFTYTHGELWG